jgi:hypothetical protein
MPAGKSQDSAILLDILIDGFEKNEILDGFHWRNLPMPDAQRQAASSPPWWPDLAIRQAGRGIMVRARAPWFDSWWHDKQTWDGDPMDLLYDWLREERGSE